MIIWSPFILDELAGLRDSAPPTINDDPTSSRTCLEDGIVTNFRRSVERRWRGLGVMSRYFGITSDADTDVAAMEFVKLLYGRGLYSTDPLDRA